MASSDDITQALFDALLTAGDGELKQLAKEIEDYKTTYHRTWKILKNKGNMASKMLVAIEEALELQNEL